jgi:hypothetical protein
VRPSEWTRSSHSFDPLLGVLILELHRAEIAECRMQSPTIVYVVYEAGKVSRDIFERLVAAR